MLKIAAESRCRLPRIQCDLLTGKRGLVATVNGLRFLHTTTRPIRVARAWRIPPPATYEMADWMDTAPPARFPRGDMRDTTSYGRHLAQLNLRRALSPCV